MPRLYLSPYHDEKLEAISAKIRSMRSVKTIYAYFNNDIDVHAIHNAKTLQQITGQPVRECISFIDASSTRKTRVKKIV